ncbi:NAD(P)H-hydrate dehydratase [Oxalobacteraceae bacterium A2-2]
MTDHAIIELTTRALCEWPLPMPSFDADKEVRGMVLVIAGSREMPGAALLAATAALRAGAGKLCVVTAASIAAVVGAALPEARVIGLEETADGGLNLSSPRGVPQLCRKADAILIGPGMEDEDATAALVRALLPDCAGKALILDAAAMRVVSHTSDGEHALHCNAAQAEAANQEAATPPLFGGPVLLTPHAGELAGLSGADKQDIAARPEQAAAEAAQRWGAVVALKGALTVIAAPDGRRWRHQGGNTGLAISGSGDALAGIVAGLAARGASIEQAAAWGVALHAMAGDQLALKHGPLGYLAREISAEVPALLRALARD